MRIIRAAAIVERDLYLKRKPKTRVEIIGKRFDRLQVIAPCGRDKNGALYIRCQCDCGNQIEVRLRSVLKGDTKSCGCKRIENIENRAIAAVIRNRPNLATAFKLIDWTKQTNGELEIESLAMKPILTIACEECVPIPAPSSTAMQHTEPSKLREPVMNNDWIREDRNKSLGVWAAFGELPSKG